MIVSMHDVTTSPRAINREVLNCKGGSIVWRRGCCRFATGSFSIYFVHSVRWSEASARVGSSCAPNQRLNVWVCVSADLEALCLAQGRLYSFLCLNQLFGIVVSRSVSLRRVSVHFPISVPREGVFPPFSCVYLSRWALVPVGEYWQSSRIVTVSLAVSLSLIP